MEMKQHRYNIEITWTGNRGEGTRNYKSYDRSHVISAKDKSAIEGSSDPSFMGDRSKYSPEDLFVSTLSSCHMLWYLHLCAVNGVIVLDYNDRAIGEMEEKPDGSGRFTKVTLKPEVLVADDSMIDKANQLHRDAHKMCFIANSVNFEVIHEPTAFTAQSA